jgi:Na+-driven multidrug efflux pump
MGIRGAALATVLAQAVSTVWLMYLLSCKHHLLSMRSMNLKHYPASLRRITGFAVPGILTMILMPISATVITRIISQFGYQAVAAVGAAGRIEMFAFMVPMALGMSLTPFVSQNFGAGRLDRVRQAHKTATGFALSYGGLTALVFFLCAPWMAAAFTRDPEVTAALTSYIRIISFGYGMMEVHRYCGFFLTGMHRPASTTLLHAVRVLVLLIPLSYLGARWGGIIGVYWGRLITDILVGGLGLIWVSRVLHSIPREDNVTGK